MRHGDTSPLTFEQELACMLSDDPRLALVHADMAAYHEANPCECDALCTCEATCDPEPTTGGRCIE
jgi:hypothetical protein